MFAAKDVPLLGLLAQEMAFHQQGWPSVSAQITGSPANSSCRPRISAATPLFTQPARTATDALPNRQRKSSVVPIKYLDPTIDIVFKLLLLRNQDLLRDMLKAVLDLRIPISTLEILNPEIPKDFPEDKAVVLDIRVRLQDNRQIDIEMQSSVRPSTRGRFLYYWAKGFADSLGEGEDYDELPPCVSVLWLKKTILRNPRFHSIFHLAEEHSHEVFAHEIEFHVLELPNLYLADASRQVNLDRWARFLRAESPDEIDQLAQEDSIMTSARNALAELSMDPEARRLAQERETAGQMHKYLLKASYKDGRKEGLLVAVRAICSILGIGVDAEKSDQLTHLSVAELEQLVARLESERKWPDDFRST